MLGGAISSMFNYKIMFISVSVFMGLTAIFFIYTKKTKHILRLLEDNFKEDI